MKSHKCLAANTQRGETCWSGPLDAFHLQTLTSPRFFFLNDFKSTIVNPKNIETTYTSFSSLSNHTEIYRLLICCQKTWRQLKKLILLSGFGQSTEWPTVPRCHHLVMLTPKKHVFLFDLDDDFLLKDHFWMQKKTYFKTTSLDSLDDHSTC